MAPASQLQSTGLIAEASSPILIVLSVGGELCLVLLKLYVLCGLPPWVVYGIKVWLRLSVGIWLDANKFWP